MKTCDWCGRTLGRNPRTGAGEWYDTCSESCRVSMVGSIQSGETAQFKTPLEGLLPKLLPLGMVILVLGFISKSCGSESSSHPKEERTLISSPSERTSGDDAASAPSPRTNRRIHGARHAVGTFDQPGQFDMTPQATSEPSTSTAGEIRTIPPPEPQASDTAF